MSDFGRVILELGGPIYFICYDRRKSWFEMHRWCGPMPIRRDKCGRFTEGTNASRKFWDAVTRWAQQGKRVSADGEAIYE